MIEKVTKQAIDKVYHLLNTSGRFVLSIDKNQDGFIDMGTRIIKIFPDKPSDIKSCLRNSNFIIREIIETEHAYIFVAKK